MITIATLLTLTIPTATSAHQQLGAPRVNYVREFPASGDVFFGSIADMDVREDGSVVVLDELAHTILDFGPDGNLTRTIGRKGQGPGEIGGSAEFELSPTGGIALIDYRNLRINFWDRNGRSFESIPLRTLSGGKMFWPHEFMWTAHGAYLKVSRFVALEPVRVLRLSGDLTRVTDTIVEFIEGAEGVASCIFCATGMLAGGVVSVVGDTVYQVSLLDESGRARHRWTRHDLPAARRDPAELERLNTGAARMSAAEGGAGRNTFSPFKPRFLSKSIAEDAFNRLWLLPSAAPGSNGSVDVFDRDGRLLTTIDFDHPVSAVKIRHGYLLVGSESALGEPIVHLYRLVN